MVKGTSDHDGVVSLRTTVETVARRALGPHDPDYEDLVQSCLEHVLTALSAGAFRGDCRLDQWAARVARNVAVDAIRARTRHRRLFSRDGNEQEIHDRPAPQAGPDRLLEVRQRLSRFQGALVSVSWLGAEVVYLHDVLGHELREVAALIGVSTGTAQKRLTRGRKKIAERLKKSGGVGAISREGAFFLSRKR